MDIIVLGSSGYIGSYLVNYFESRGIDVVSANSTNCNLLEDNSIQLFFKSLPKKKYLLIYLSVINRNDGDCFEGLQKNILMTGNLVYGLDRQKITSVIYFSSVDVYGNRAELPIKENTPLMPDNWYGLAKANCEWILKSELDSKIPLTIIRLPGVYGSSPGENSIIQKFITDIFDRKKVTVFGDGSTLRDYVHVKDVAKIIEYLMNNSAVGVINIVTGESYSLLNILNILKNAIEIPWQIEFIEQSQRHFDLTFDNSKLLELTPRLKFINIEEGIGSSVTEFINKKLVN
jgi:UDP-glucose 4-epimerase